MVDVHQRPHCGQMRFAIHGGGSCRLPAHHAPRIKECAFTDEDARRALERAAEQDRRAQLRAELLAFVAVAPIEDVELLTRVAGRMRRV